MFFYNFFDNSKVYNLKTILVFNTYFNVIFTQNNYALHFNSSKGYSYSF